MDRNYFCRRSFLYHGRPKLGYIGIMQTHGFKVGDRVRYILCHESRKTTYNRHKNTVYGTVVSINGMTVSVRFGEGMKTQIKRIMPEVLEKA